MHKHTSSAPRWRMSSDDIVRYGDEGEAWEEAASEDLFLEVTKGLDSQLVLDRLLDQLEKIHRDCREYGVVRHRGRRRVRPVIS